tara:strand:- start:599 stop:1195 length:597 start_codon:yes stop_codon:yes gene_type:complete
MFHPDKTYSITVRLRQGERREIHNRWGYSHTITELESHGHRTERGGQWKKKIVGPEPSSYRGPAPFAVMWFSEKNGAQTDIYKEYTFLDITIGKWTNAVRGTNDTAFALTSWYRDTITDYISRDTDSSTIITTPLMIEFLQGPMNRDMHAPGWTYPTARFIPMHTPVEEGYDHTHSRGAHIRYIKKIPLASGESTGEQ